MVSVSVCTITSAFAVVGVVNFVVLAGSTSMKGAAVSTGTVGTFVSTGDALSTSDVDTGASASDGLDDVSGGEMTSTWADCWRGESGVSV